MHDNNFTLQVGARNTYYILHREALSMEFINL